MRKIEISAKTNDFVLPETFGCRANSKGIVPPWVAGCVARVLSRSEKNNVDHNAHVRSKMRKCRDVLTQDGGAVILGTSVVRRQRWTQAGPRESPWVAPK